MQRIIVHRLWDRPRSLVLEDRDDLVPGEGQVLVEVAAAGVNFVDALFVAGTYQIKVAAALHARQRAGRHRDRRRPRRRRLAVGDRVLSTLGLGGVRQPRGRARRAALTAVPDELSLPARPRWPSRYCTALVRPHPPHHGRAAAETVLVLGAGGGVGLAAIDVGHARSAPR